MKQFFLLLTILTTTPLFAQSSNFTQILESTLTKIPTQSTTDNWQATTKNFDQIATNYPNEWLANYYVAYAYMNLAGTYEDQTLPIVATHLDKAQVALDKANELAANDVEILVLQGFIYIARIWESPFLNGGLYGRKISKLFKEAIAIDPENPRAYYLKGLLTYHTPRFVGGGKERAKPWLEQSKEKFENFTIKPKIYPSWGATENQTLLMECSGKIEKEVNQG